MEDHMTINKTKTPFSDSDINSVTTNSQNNDIETIHANSATEIIGSLKNHFLIAMPSLTDDYFKQSVVYLCEHDEQGAMGFIINNPVKLTLQELLKNAESIEHLPTPPLTDTVYLGGPLDMDRGFVLHSPTKDNSQSTVLNEQLLMSNSNHILSTLGTAQEPEKYIVTLGYSSWDLGQLEEEISQNQWLTVHCDANIIFDTPIDKRWNTALKLLGIDPLQLSSEIGHA